MRGQTDRSECPVSLLCPGSQACDTLQSCDTHLRAWILTQRSSGSHSVFLFTDFKMTFPTMHLCLLGK